MNINAEEVAKDCARAIAGYAKTFPDQKHDQIIVQELISLVSDCITKDPTRIAPIVQWTTDHYIQKAKDYSKNDSAK
jgi:hypothetical protein